MDPQDVLRSGDVHGTLDVLKQAVRQAPRDPRLRTFLFQLFCITGDWDRALTQLTVVAELDPLSVPMTQAYQTAIRSEVLRESVFRGERAPTVLGNPDSWLPLLIEAIRLLAAGHPNEAAGLRDQAFDQAAETAGSLNGTGFAWIADADPRLGPVMEVVLNGTYLWVPFSRLRSLKLEPPSDLRDQVWMPAQFTWTNGGEAMGLIPTRYPGSVAVADAGLALARRTEWQELTPDWSLPLGQRVLVTDVDEVALMDVRNLRINAPEPGAS